MVHILVAYHQCLLTIMVTNNYGYHRSNHVCKQLKWVCTITITYQVTTWFVIMVVIDNHD